MSEITGGIHGGEDGGPHFPRTPPPGFGGGGGGSRQPPHSTEAEESVLGGLLFDNHAIHSTADLNLAPEDFYREGHQRIFRAMTARIARGEPADIVTVTNALRTMNELDKAGGARYLSELADRAFSSAHVPYYAKIVKEKSVLRSFIRTANDLVGAAYSGVEEQESFLDEAEKKIFAVTSLKQTHFFDPLKDILLRNFIEIEQNAANQGGTSGVPSGFVDLDAKTTGWKPGQLIIVAARPGMGKTSFMLNIGI